MISTSDISKAKQMLKTEKKPIVVEAQNEEFNRKILEYGKFDVIVGVERQGRESLRQVDSGFNQVLAELCRKNKISLGIDMSYIHGLKGIEKAKILGRIRQNIVLCRKSGVKIKLLNSSGNEGMNFLLSLGASSGQARDACL